MLPLIALGLLAAFSSSAAGPVSSAPCWIQDVTSVGKTAWLLCDREQLFISPDAGVTWERAALPGAARLRAMAFLDANRGFIIGDNGTLLITANGKDWREAQLPVTEHLRDIEFAGDSAWIAGYGGTILHSTDAGRTWTRQPIAQSLSIEDIFFLDEKRGWAAGWNGAILRTTDGGRNWKQEQSPAALWTLSSLYFRDAENGWAVGMSGQILRTRDGGATWEAQEAPVKSWFTSVLFDTAGRGWITADTDLLVSDDGGESWKGLGYDERLFLEKLVPVNGSLWAVGPFGILKRDGSGLAWKKLTTVRGSS